MKLILVWNIGVVTRLSTIVLAALLASTDHGVIRVVEQPTVIASSFDSIKSPAIEPAKVAQPTPTHNPWT
jgi:hypothetical protein